MFVVVVLAISEKEKKNPVLLQMQALETQDQQMLQPKTVEKNSLIEEHPNRAKERKRSVNRFN